MLMNKKIQAHFLLLFILAMPSQAKTEAYCGIEAIKFYLANNFSTEQISRMCQMPTHSDSAFPNIQKAKPLAYKTKLNPEYDSETLFFNRSIISNQLTVSGSILQYRAKECIRYGDEDITGFKEKICTNISTRIQRHHLEIMSVTKKSFFSDNELLVKGNIKREIFDKKTLSNEELEILAEHLNLNPKVFEIKLRDDADPQQVADALILKK